MFKVIYNVQGFLEKNCDYLQPEIVSLLRQSEISLIRSLFRNSLTRTGSILNKYFCCFNHIFNLKKLNLKIKIRTKPPIFMKAHACIDAFTA